MVALAVELMSVGYLAIANRTFVEVYPRRHCTHDGGSVRGQADSFGGLRVWLREQRVDETAEFSGRFLSHRWFVRMRQQFRQERRSMARALTWWAQSAGRQRTHARNRAVKHELMTRACAPHRLMQIVPTDDAEFLQAACVV